MSALARPRSFGPRSLAARTPWVFLLGLLAASPYLAGGPVWDDHELILGRLARLDARGLWELWGGAVGQGSVGDAYMRPLSLTLMALLGRLGIPAIHLVVAVLHAGSALMVQRLSGSARAGLLAGAVFAVHPVVGEVLGWASALPDALAVHLCLWSAVLVRSAPWGAGLLALGALLAKESSYVLLPLLAWAVGTSRRAAMGLLGVVVTALVARLMVGVAPGGPGALRPTVAVEGLLHGLGLLVAPWPLSPIRDLRASDPVLQGVGAVVAVALVAAAVLRPRLRAASALVVLPIAAALPTVMSGYLFGERYVYPALVGVSLLVGHLMDAAPTTGGRRGGRVGDRMALALGVGFLLISLMVHQVRGPAWQSDLALFGAATSSRPHDSSAWHMRGKAHVLAAEPGPAAAAYRRAVAAGHPYPTDYRDVVVMDVLAGNHAQALAWAEAGPTEGLRAEDLAWWARAAHGAGEHDRARTLLAPLRTPSGWDGPEWVPALAQELARAQSTSP